MPKNSFSSNLRFYVIAAGIVLSAGFTLASITAGSGGWWMFPAISGGIATFFLFRQWQIRQQRMSTHQGLVQAYRDRLLQAESPDEWQPILSEMTSKQLLKGIRLSSFDLDELDLSGADLSHADLSGATLSGTNLTGANLTGATLSYTALSYITLHGAILKGANLRGVNLHGADLRQTDLTGAQMRGAVLSQAALTGAVLRNAQLHGANLLGADLHGADLSGATLTGATLPDGSEWSTCTELGAFTDSNLTDSWQPDGLFWPVHPSSKMR